MTRLAKLPAVAAAVAFCLAGIGLLSALHQIALAVFALVPLAAGIGILRRRVWSAYGFGLFEAGQLIVAAILLMRSPAVTPAQIIVRVLWNALLVALFFAAGKVLASNGAKRGWVSPWILLTVLGSVPFFFVEAFVVPTAGMENTVLAGDRILTRVFPAVTPGRGDVVVFHYPVDRRQLFVKRVIGIPGDRIRIVNSIVYRNDAPIVEPYAVHKFVAQGSYRDNFPSDPKMSLLRPNGPEIVRLQQMFNQDVRNGELVVPPDSYFVLGDNRDNSFDSRYWGLLDKRDLIGKALVIYDSEEPAPVGNNGARLGRIRWNRMFHWL